MSTEPEIEAYLAGALVTPGHEHDVLAVAPNERFFELGGHDPVAYRGDGPTRP